MMCKSSHSGAGYQEICQKEHRAAWSHKGEQQLGVFDGYVKRMNRVAIFERSTENPFDIADGTIYLHDLNTYEQQTVLGSSSETKGQAGIFALETSIQTSGPLSSKGKEKEKQQNSPSPAKGKGRRGKAVAEPEVERQGVPIVATTLAVGCRRRLVLFGWRDGQWQDPKVGFTVSFETLSEIMHIRFCRRSHYRTRSAHWLSRCLTHSFSVSLPPNLALLRFLMSQSLPQKHNLRSLSC